MRLKEHQLKSEIQMKYRIAFVSVLSHVWFSATPWIIAHQASLSTEFFRQEYWSGLPFPPPGSLLHPGISCIGRQVLYQCTSWEAQNIIYIESNIYKPTITVHILEHLMNKKIQMKHIRRAAQEQRWGKGHRRTSTWEFLGGPGVRTPCAHWFNHWLGK